MSSSKIFMTTEVNLKHAAGTDEIASKSTSYIFKVPGVVNRCLSNLVTQRSCACRLLQISGTRSNGARKLPRKCLTRFEKLLKRGV